MELIKKINELYGYIFFEDDTHSYYNRETGEILTSVTTKLKQLQQPFNYHYWLTKKAKEENVLPHVIAERWELAKIEGSGIGSFLHDYLENLFKNKSVVPSLQRYGVIETDLIKEKKETLLHFADNYRNDHEHILSLFTEQIIGTQRIAGQFDFLGYNTKNNKYTLRDYKTDKKIDTENKYQNFKKPITHLQNCEFNKYALQLSFYRYILEPLSLDFEENKVIWFNQKNDNYAIIELPYLKNEIISILENDNK